MGRLVARGHVIVIGATNTECWDPACGRPIARPGPVDANRIGVSEPKTLRRGLQILRIHTRAMPLRRCRSAGDCRTSHGFLWAARLERSGKRSGDALARFLRASAVAEMGLASANGGWVTRENFPCRLKM